MLVSLSAHGFRCSAHAHTPSCLHFSLMPCRVPYCRLLLLFSSHYFLVLWWRRGLCVTGLVTDRNRRRRRIHIFLLFYISLPACPTTFSTTTLCICLLPHSLLPCTAWFYTVIFLLLAFYSTFSLPVSFCTFCTLPQHTFAVLLLYLCICFHLPLCHVAAFSPIPGTTCEKKSGTEDKNRQEL